MSEQLNVMVQKHRNNCSREYHLKTRISDTSIYNFRFPATDEEISFSGVGRIGENIAKHLNGVEGILELFIKLHSFTIVISPAYAWDEVENDIFHTLELMYGKTVVVNE